MVHLADRIREWAKDIPFWERVALDKIASGVAITDEDCQFLVDCLLYENSLKTLSNVPADPSLAGLGTSSVGPKTRLISISGLQGVNALVPDQKIAFSPSLTAVYGENGSGKSGYARVLGCAGFTRGDVHILPDYNIPPDECCPATANIEVDNGTCTRTVFFKADTPGPELRCFHVFDSTSVIAHVAKSHGFSFTPAAISCFPRLVEATDRVRALLDRQIEEHRTPRDFTRLFAGESTIVPHVKLLSLETDMKQLKALATITSEDASNREELERQKAELLLKNTAKRMADLQTQIRDLRALAEKIRATEEMLGDAAASSVHDEVAEYVRLKSLAAAEGADQFIIDGLTRVGSEEWQAFALQAKALAEAEGQGRDSYPQTGDICLLCHQPLNTEACSLIARLWAYLRGEARMALATAEERLRTRLRAITALDLQFFSEQLVSRRYLESRNETLAASIAAFVGFLSKRRDTLLVSLQTHEPINIPRIEPAPSPELAVTVEELQVELAALQNQDHAAELEKINDELRLLDHKEILAKNLDQIEKYVDDLKWARKAERCKGSTRHITIKYNELFHELVTNQYLAIFEKRLKQLDCPMRVGIATKPEKGRVMKHIVLVAAHDAADSVPSPDKILSEGEKRAVALADFLTEVELDEHSSGIVIDDPVTSLDYHWKGIIANSLASEAKLRQVIVFTHDLHFLWMLNKEAADRDMEAMIHWIKRGDGDDRPGYVYLNNCPGLEKSYRETKIARRFLEEAKDAEPQEQEILLKQGFGALRTTYEAFVLHDLLRDVVGRWGERIGMEGKLDKILLDDAVVSTVVQKHGHISGYIEGHLHSDTVPKPSVKALEEEIKAFEALRKQHRDLLKTAGKY